MPLRVVRLEGTGRNACRASAEITVPTFFRSVAAIFFAAARTSLSMLSVVRMGVASKRISPNQQEATKGPMPGLVFLRCFGIF